MAKRSSTRRTHASTGITFKETEVKYSTKSLGITTLGLAGETVKGPAFQTIPIADWREYQSYFGGTNTEKFRGSQYPKYELPYIAQEYLKQSKQLEVVRVLGLSGVNAGPAWVLTATKHDCREGYEYEPEIDETTGEQKISTDANLLVAGDTREGGLYTSGVAFSVPEGEASTEEVSPLANCWVLDSYVNTNTDIMYFDDNKEEQFEVLPEGIQLLFGDVNTLEQVAIDNSWGVSILSVSFDNMFANGSFTDGKVAVMFEKGEYGKVVKIYDLTDRNECLYDSQAGQYDPSTLDTNRVNFVTVIDDEGETHEYNFVLIPKSEFETAIDAEHYDPYDSISDFTTSKIKIRHYLYSEENADGNRYTEETGIYYGYTSSEHKTICIEDVDAGFNNVVIGVIRSRG